MFTISATGRLGGDPEVNEASGTKVANFSIATENGRGDGTHWIDVAAWGQQAEFAAEYFSKGDGVEVYGEGEIDEDYGVSMTANQVRFAPGSNENNAPEASDEDAEFAPDEELPF